MVTATRYIGTCPVCFGEWKLRKMVMVHHGYRVPHGFFQGDCYGVGWTPWELSPDGNIAYVESALQPDLESSTEFLRQLRSGEIQELRVEVRLGFGERKMKVLTPADGREFQEQVRIHAINTENHIRHLTKDIAERVQQISQWRKGTVRTEEEVVQARERMTAGRREVIEQARQAKRDKRAALDAKQRAREQEQLDLIEEYRELFHHLAAQPQTTSVRAEAKAAWVKMHKRMDKKGYLHFYPHKLEADEALQTLGLAAPSTYGPGMAYANDLGWGAGLY
jgi:hypothetical protein